MQNGVSRQCHRECTLKHAHKTAEGSENANVSFDIRFSFSGVDAGKRCENASVDFETLKAECFRKRVGVDGTQVANFKIGKN